MAKLEKQIAHEHKEEQKAIERAATVKKD